MAPTDPIQPFANLSSADYRSSHVAEYVKVPNYGVRLISETLQPWSCGSPWTNLARLSSKERRLITEKAHSDEFACAWAVDRKAFKTRLNSSNEVDEQSLWQEANAKVIEMMFGTVLQTPSPAAYVVLFGSAIAVGALAPWLLALLLEAFPEMDSTPKATGAEQTAAALKWGLMVFSLLFPFLLVSLWPRFVATFYAEGFVSFARWQVSAATGMGIVAAISVFALR